MKLPLRLAVENAILFNVPVLFRLLVFPRHAWSMKLIFFKHLAIFAHDDLNGIFMAQ
jgi:hypothetical protein